MKLYLISSLSTLLEHAPDSSANKKRALAFNEGLQSSQSAKLTRRVSSGASVYPPSLIVWENAIDGFNNNNNGANSVGKAQMRQGTGVRQSRSPRGYCADACNGIPKGTQAGADATADSSSTYLNGLTDITDPMQSSIRISSSNSTSKSCHERNGEFVWDKKKKEEYGSRKKVCNEELSEDRICNDDEDDECDSSLLFAPNCVQSVTTIIVDEGDMNPLKVRTMYCTVHSSKIGIAEMCYSPCSAVKCFF